MANPTVIKLQDGNVMPQLGLGVWQASNEEVITAIQKALDVGYRSIDTAAAYKNEEGVGKALKNASVNREELFITTKLWNDDHKRPREALLDSLKKLQLDYIDLYLMHWPVPAIDHYVEAWKGMIELQKEGLIKSIGVCNFQIHQIIYYVKNILFRKIRRRTCAKRRGHVKTPTTVYTAYYSHINKDIKSIGAFVTSAPCK